MEAVIQQQNEMQQSVLERVTSGAYVEVEDIVRGLPVLRWQGVFSALRDLHLQGKIVLEHHQGERCGLVRKVGTNRKIAKFQSVSELLMIRNENHGR